MRVELGDITSTYICLLNNVMLPLVVAAVFTANTAYRVVQL